MRKLDTILFDLDGTLIDSNQLIIDAFKKVFQERFKDITLSEEEYRSFIGPTLWASFSKYESDPIKVEELVKLYRHYNNLNHDHVQAFKGAKTLLQTLKERGFKIGVVSSKMRHMVMRGLTVTGLYDYVDVVVGMDEVKNHKPHPESLHKALRLLKGVEAMYVGDHPDDIKAGKGASMMTCGVSYSWHKKQLQQENPDLMIDCLLELLEVV